MQAPPFMYLTSENPLKGERSDLWRRKKGKSAHEEKVPGSRGAIDQPQSTPPQSKPSDAGARALTSPANDNSVQVRLPPAQTWITTPPSGQKHE